MTKATVWNSLKATGYTTEQLKLDLGISYQQVSLQQLQSLLEANQTTVYQVGTMFRGLLSKKFTTLEQAYEEMRTYSTNELINEDSVILVEIKNGVEVVIDSLSKEEMGGVSESLGSQCGGVTAVTKDSSEVKPAIYKGISVEHFTLDGYFDHLEDIYNKSTLADNEVILVWGIYKLDEYILRTNEDNIECVSLLDVLLEAKDYLESQVTVTTKTNINIFKGIKIEHFTVEEYNKHIENIYATEIKDERTLLLIPDAPNECFNYLRVKGKGSYFSSLSQLMIAAENYLRIGVNTETVPFSEQPLFTDEEIASFDFTKILSKQLTPKLKLFTAITNYTYLMQCYSYLISLSESTTDLNSVIFDSWFTIIYLLTGSYIMKPQPSLADYIKLLQLNQLPQLQLA